MVPDALDRDSFFRILGEEVQRPLQPLDLVYGGELPLFDKYDEYLPESLVKKGFAEGILNIREMQETIKSWAAR